MYRQRKFEERFSCTHTAEMDVWVFNLTSLINTPGGSADESFGLMLKAPKPNFGGLAIFGASGKNTRTLVIGTQAGDVCSVAQWFGSEVTHMPSVTMNRASQDSPLPQTRRSNPTLPFDDETFNTVFLAGALDWWECGTASRGAQLALLKECSRVLRRAGILLAPVDNRLSIMACVGSRHPSTGIRFFGLWPRAVYGILSQQLRERARSYLAYSRRGWVKLLTEAGFSQEGCKALWPSTRGWMKAVPVTPDHMGGFAEYSNSALKVHLSQCLVRGLKIFNVQHDVSPGFLLVARKRSADDEPGNEVESDVLGEVIASENYDALVVRNLPNSQCVCFSLTDTFFKIALNEAAYTGIARQADATEVLQRYAIRDYVPLPAELNDTQSVHYLTCPAISPDESAPSTETQVGQILSALGRDARWVRLSGTALWSRINDIETRHGLERLGWASLLNALDSKLGQRMVYAGLVHGDLHAGNVLQGPDGPVLIDWDHYEENAPLFLDAIEAVKMMIAKRRGGPRALILDLETLIANSPNLPLRSQVFERDDELSVPEMVACFLFWRAADRVRRSRPSESEITDLIPSAWLTLAERLIFPDS